MLLLHSLPTCADAGLDFCTFCPDLCTLRLWCYSINQCKYSTCTQGGGHWLQLALGRFSFSHWHRHSLHWWVCYPLQLALVVFLLPPTGADTAFVLEQLALYGGIYTYVRIYIYIYYLTPLVSTQVTPPPSSTPPPPSSLNTLSSLMYNRQQGGMDNSG